MQQKNIVTSAIKSVVEEVQVLTDGDYVSDVEVRLLFHRWRVETCYVKNM